MQQDPAVAVVTGASRGIGRAVAERLAANGTHVMVGYRRSAEAAADVVTELKRLGGGGTAVQAELEEPDGVSALFDAAASRFGRVDYFVSCAAAAAFKHVVDLKQYHLDRAYAVNFRAFVAGAQEAVQLMDRGGRIVALTSYGSTRVFPAYALLGSYKAAVEAMVRYMAVEFAGYGINVNAVNGGLVASDSLDHYYGLEGQVPLPDVLRSIPKKRAATAGELAQTVHFLLSPAAEYITGQTLAVDGGLSLPSPPFHADMGAALALPPRPVRAQPDSGEHRKGTVTS
ncbi:NAD(P)-dependent dehydrogenase (short-subunit alcohol dehydrogenase family) [Arthrobacter sp. UYP6]|uniref:SDR family oxidoreductase n=1 Tax=Arthrobacter sp. UYP6 TaxID=1756378 RepID=UPI0033908D80